MVYKTGSSDVGLGVLFSQQEINKEESHDLWKLPQTTNVSLTSEAVNLTQHHVILSCQVPFDLYAPC